MQTNKTNRMAVLQRQVVLNVDSVCVVTGRAASCGWGDSWVCILASGAGSSLQCVNFMFKGSSDIKIDDFKRFIQIACSLWWLSLVPLHCALYACSTSPRACGSPIKLASCCRVAANTVWWMLLGWQHRSHGFLSQPWLGQGIPLILFFGIFHLHLHSLSLQLQCTRNVCLELFKSNKAAVHWRLFMRSIFTNRRKHLK